MIMKLKWVKKHTSFKTILKSNKKHRCKKQRNNYSVSFTCMYFKSHHHYYYDDDSKIFPFDIYM